MKIKLLALALCTFAAFSSLALGQQDTMTSQDHMMKKDEMTKKTPHSKKRHRKHRPHHMSDKMTK